MPLFKNLKDEVCQVLEPEVSLVVKAGWKQLNEAEEAAYREGLKVDHALTSAAAIEEARVKAGLYNLVQQVVGEGEKVATEAETAAKNAAKKSTTKKPAAAKKLADTSKPSDTATSTEKPAETAANTASEGSNTDATK